MSAKGIDIKAGAAFVELFVKDQKLSAGLKSAQAKLLSFGKGVGLLGALFASMGAAITAPMAGMVYSFASTSEELQKMSERTGFAASELQQLGRIAKLSGTDLEHVEAALRYMAKSGRNANNFYAIAESIAAIENPSRRAQRAMEVWGKKTGTALLPMLASLKAFGAGGKGLGLTNAQIKMGDELAQSLKKMQGAISGSMNQLAAAVAPTVKLIVDGLTSVIRFAGGIARDFPLLTQIVTGLGVAFGVIGTVMLTVASIAAIVGAAIAPLAAVWSALPAILAAIFSPIGAIVVGIVALVAIVVAATTYFLLFTQMGRKLLDAVLKPVYDLLKRFAGLGDVFKKTFGGITDAIKAGDMGKVWEIVLLGMTAAWHEFAATVLNGIADFAEALAKLAKFGVFGLGGLAIGPIGKFARDLATSNTLDSKIAQGKIDRIRKGLATKPKSPEDKGYGLGEKGSQVIGFNARAALMSRQIAGGGRNQVLDTMQKWLELGDKQLNKLEEIRKRSGGIKLK